MERRVTLITLGVSEVARSKAFYEALGWKGQEVEETVFIQAAGLALVLWDAEELATDAGLTAPPPAHSGGIVLAHNVRSREEVDAIIVSARGAMATITQAPRETSYGGYAGFFADPDGHIWEIAFNPGFQLKADGSVVLPDFSKP